MKQIMGGNVNINIFGPDLVSLYLSLGADRAVLQVNMPTCLKAKPCRVTAWLNRKQIRNVSAQVSHAVFSRPHTFLHSLENGEESGKQLQTDILQQ